MLREKLAGLSRDALIYGVGDGLGRLVGLVMLPILSRVFGPADYGTIDLLAITYTFGLVLLQLGIPSGVQRFYFREEDGPRRATVTSSLLYMVIIAATCSAAMFVLADPLARRFPQVGETLVAPIQILAIVLPIELTYNFMVLLLRLRRRAPAFAAINIANIILTPTLTYIFVVSLDRGLTGVFAAKLAALTTLTLVLLASGRHQFSRNVSVGRFWHVFRFAVSGHPALLIVQAMNIAPRYVLAAYAPLTEVGLFGIALRLSNVMRIFVEAFNRAWNPFAYANEGAPEERRIYELVLKGAVIVLCTLGSALAMFAPEVLRVLTPPEYAGAQTLIPGVVTYLALDRVVLVFSTILYTRNRVRWTSYLGILKLAVFFAAAALLVPSHHAVGLVVSLCIAAAIHLAGYVYAATRVFEMSIPVVRILSVAVFVTSISLGTLSTSMRLAPTLTIKFAAVVAIFIVASLLVLERSERHQLIVLLRQAPARLSRNGRDG